VINAVSLLEVSIGAPAVSRHNHGVGGVDWFISEFHAKSTVTELENISFKIHFLNWFEL